MLIRDLENKFFSASTIYSKVSNITLSSNVDIAIDINNTLFNNFCDNFDEMRGWSMTSDKQDTRTLFMSSSKYDKRYLARVQGKSDRMVENNLIVASDSPQLKYTTLKTQSNHVSKATDYIPNMRQQCAKYKIPIFNNNINNMDFNNSDIINIQLNYNINQALD